MQGDSGWRARALIDLNALRENIVQIRRIASGSKILAVIKADAYGHGMQEICAAVRNDVDGFAVATVNEGVKCRELQRHRPVVVLSEFWNPSQLEVIEEFDLQPVVHSEFQVKWLREYTGKPITVWIKFDTGMNRLGVEGSSVKTIFDQLSGLQQISQIRLMSHLANADVVDDSYTLQQLSLFNEISGQYSCEKSLANTAGVMRWPDTHFDWVRPGLMLYGVSPYPLKEADQISLKPVMQLQARLLSIKLIEANKPVGYGGIYRTKKQSRIAMVGFGYGDGYPRMVDDRASVLINHQRAAVIGRISMDMITIDVSDIEGVYPGQAVTLWGEGLCIEEVAEWAGTIPYELMCKVTPRIPRVIV